MISKPTFKQVFMENLGHFFQKTRFFFVIFAGVILVLLIGIGVYSEFYKQHFSQSLLKLEAFQTTINDWYNTSDDAKKADIEKKAEESIIDISKNFAGTIAQQKSYFLLAHIYTQKKLNDKAAEYFIKGYESLPTSYLAPICLNNAAVAFEEAGKPDKALENYLKVGKEFGKNYVDTPRNWLNAGRIYELQGKYKEALEAYTQIVENYSSSKWTDVANDNIISLKAQGKIETKAN